MGLLGTVFDGPGLLGCRYSGALMPWLCLPEFLALIMALGISTSAIAIIAYNYFTTKIDGLTYGIDEAGFSLAQSFAAKH
jgi:biopolymer transport protein ExbB